MKFATLMNHCRGELVPHRVKPSGSATSGTEMVIESSDNVQITPDVDGVAIDKVHASAFAAILVT